MLLFEEVVPDCHGQPQAFHHASYQKHAGRAQCLSVETRLTLELLYFYPLYDFLLLFFKCLKLGFRVEFFAYELKHLS